MFETEHSLKNSTYSEWKKTNGQSRILSRRSELLRIAVVGTGAIGCLFGGRLQKAGQSVLLIHHKSSVAATIEKTGDRIRELSGKVVRTRIRTRTSLSKSDEPELVLITVKAYDTEPVASLLRKSIGRNVPVLSLQNGLGNVESLRRRLGSDSINAGTTTEAALGTGPGSVIHNGTGSNWGGEKKCKHAKRGPGGKRGFQEAGFSPGVRKNTN